MSRKTRFIKFSESYPAPTTIRQPPILATLLLNIRAKYLAAACNFLLLYILLGEFVVSLF
jgi:hypothetical protein